MLPIPPHFDPDRVGELRRVPYEQLAAEAERWARMHSLRPAADDRVRICLLAVEVQNPLTEHYSILGPEVTTGPDGDVIGEKNQGLIDRLFAFDAIVIAGQAK